MSGFIRMSESHRDFARMLCDGRLAERERNNRVGYKKISPLSDGKVNFLGVCAELHVALRWNVMPDLDTSGPKPYDMVIAGFKVDVKCTEHEWGKLLLPEGTTGNGVDLYCLVICKVICKEPYFRVAGFMSKMNLLQADRLKRQMHNFAYEAGQHELVRDPVQAMKI